MHQERKHNSKNKSAAISKRTRYIRICGKQASTFDDIKNDHQLGSESARSTYSYQSKREKLTAVLENKMQNREFAQK